MAARRLRLRQSHTLPHTFALVVVLDLWSTRGCRLEYALHPQLEGAIQATPKGQPLSRPNGKTGIRTLGGGVCPLAGLANRCIRPLCHLSRN